MKAQSSQANQEQLESASPPPVSEQSAMVRRQSRLPVRSRNSHSRRGVKRADRYRDPLSLNNSCICSSYPSRSLSLDDPSLAILFIPPLLLLLLLVEPAPALTLDPSTTAPGLFVALLLRSFSEPRSRNAHTYIHLLSNKRPLTLIINATLASICIRTYAVAATISSRIAFEFERRLSSALDEPAKTSTTWSL